MTSSPTDRQKIIRNSLKAYKDNKITRTYSIKYRGDIKDLPVVRLQTSALLLNHNNSRLSAQLDEHPNKELVHSAPGSADAQRVLYSLLESTDKFDDLKKQLKLLGQQNPGLTTRDGLLINGNTRMVAIDVLQAEGLVDGIDVAVLPEDATIEDLIDIEMGLQMTDLIHQDYSFTNELLMMQRYIGSGKTNKQLAKKMAWIRSGEKKVEQHLRMLTIIEDVRRVCGKPPIPYSAFDSKKQHLKDLDEQYQSLKNAGQLAEAERLKWTRLTAIFLNVNKDQVRAIEDDFIEYEILRRADEGGSEADVKDFLEDYKIEIQDDGLDDILDDDGSMRVDIDMRKVFKDLLKSTDLRKADGSIEKDFGGVGAVLATEIRRSADAIIQEQKDQTQRLEPSKILREARYSIMEVKKKLPEVSAMKDFETGDFQEQLEKLAKEVKDTQKIVSKITS